MLEKTLSVIAKRLISVLSTFVLSLFITVPDENSAFTCLGIPTMIKDIN